MPAERTAMRHVREVLRLRTAGISGNEIARRLNLAPSTVRLTLQRLTTAGLDWPLPAELTDAALEARLFSAVGTKQGHRRRAEPDWAEVHRELKRKHVTLQILWDEYIERHPDGYRYSRFCELYRGWASRLSVTMRQTYAGGDKLFVDYAGDTVPVIIDRLSGKTRPAQIFVAVLGASNFTYAEASWTQGLGDCGPTPALVVAIGGDHHDRDLRPHFLDLAQQAEAVHAGHVDVGQDDNRPRPDAVGQHLQRLLGRGHEVQRVEPLRDLAAEVLAERLGDVGLIIDAPDADGHLPSPTLLRAGAAAGAR